MEDRSFFLTWQAIRRQLAAMPNDLYLIRLIHNRTGRPFPGERLWTAAQLVGASTIRFLRARNREGCDVYIHPYAGGQNAGYVLVDLDGADSTVVDCMRANGHDPCVVVRTSPGHLQTWIRLSLSPLEPAVATAAARHLAHLYGGDGASADWRHLGRLAGFTNQKPVRRTLGGYAPWARLVHARAGLAPHGKSLVASVRQSIPSLTSPLSIDWTTTDPYPASSAEAVTIYRGCMQRWRIRERFPQPDWSIVDLWIARALLARGIPPAEVQQILQLGSPGFPRGHSHAADYLRRTLARAFPVFPAPGGGLCAAHAPASTTAPADSERSNFTGEQ